MDLYHSRLTPDDPNDLIIKYKIPRDLHPWLPLEEFVMSELSDDAIAILDAMVWRHPDAAIDDPRPAAGSFNMDDVRRLSAHVIKLRDMPKGVLVLSGLSQVWKNRFCNPVLWGTDGNVIGIHDFLCLPEWTGAKVQEEPHLDVRPTLQRLLFYCTPPDAANVVIPNPTLEDLAAGDDDESDDDDACVEIPLVTPLRSAAVIPSSGNQGRSSVAPTVEGSNTQDSRGRGIMVDDVAAPFGGFPTPGEMVRVEGLSDDQLTAKISVLHCMMMSHGGELLARYHGLNQSHHEYVLSTDSMLKGYEEKSKAKGKERKKKIKSLSKSLDNLHSELSCLSAALNQATILETERDEEILRLKATPPRFFSFFWGQFQGLVQKFLASDEFSRVQGELLSLAARFERGLSMHQTKDKFADIFEYDAEPLSVILQLEPEKLVHPANVPIPRDTRVSPPIAKESIMTPNEEQVSVAVDGSDLEMTDGAAYSKSEGVFVQGTSYVLDDVVEVTMVGSECVSSGLTDVVVALSAGEKGDGSGPSSTVEEERGAWYAREHLLLRAWGKLTVDVLLSIQWILSHATRPKPNGFPLGPVV
ncbi:hypothetical protein Tco_0157070 [Tanacetum coccineum]